MSSYHPVESIEFEARGIDGIILTILALGKHKWSLIITQKALSSEYAQ